MSLAATLAGACPPALGAQTDVTVEVGASQVGPALGLDTESARFGVGGIRASHQSLDGSGVSLSVLAGRTFGDADGGDFITVDLGGTLVEEWTSAWEGSLDFRLLAFGVRAPFPYRAVALEAGPALRFGSGAVSVKVSALAGAGRSRFEIWRVAGGRTRVFLDPLYRLGSTMEVALGTGPIRVATVGGFHGTSGGSFTSGGARVTLGGGWGAAELRADVWRTPLGTETTGGVTLVIPLSGWSLRAFFGRSEPDPLTLAEPGSTGGGVLLGRSLFSREVGLGTGVLPYEVVSGRATGARVRLSIEAPAGAGRVVLLGDFTLWEPVPMQHRNGRWEIEIDVRAGTHHYGFLVDDEWYVPADTRDVVPDEWGRMSAILVIEGVD
jgi:hypothetical protein